jgi:hypothetical protein
VSDSQQTSDRAGPVPATDDYYRFQCDGCGHTIVVLEDCAPYELIAWMRDGTGGTLARYCSRECADQ